MMPYLAGISGTQELRPIWWITKERVVYILWYISARLTPSGILPLQSHFFVPLIFFCICSLTPSMYLTCDPISVNKIQAIWPAFTPLHYKVMITSLWMLGLSKSLGEGGWVAWRQDNQWRQQKHFWALFSKPNCR